MTCGQDCGLPIKRAVIAFAVDTKKVSIIGLFYGGRDYETMLNESE
ncbi:Toxin of a toxin/antitoxin system (fragment) [Cupriavidus neocaledonicus]|uniref:Toxin of a toxin/antitoxin system n=1 Tax=Cupriavidus neocaledonicus TaxID=1040979 RepID=A0A375H1J7_9BURK